MNVSKWVTAGVMLTLFLLVACVSAPPRTSGRGVPPIPRSVPSQLGPVPVLIVDSILSRDSTLDLMGGFDLWRRRIYLKRQLGPVQMWQVLYHEVCHVWMFDSGLRQVTPTALEEAICDASATARVAELLQPHR